MRMRGWVAALGLAAMATGCSDTPQKPDPAPSSASPTPVALPPVTPLEDVKAKRVKVPGFVDWLVMAGGDAWASTRAPDVRRYDGRSGKPAGRTGVPDEICAAMDVGFESVWAAACASAVLVRIDPRDGSIEERIPVGSKLLQAEASVGAGEGAVWVLTARPDPILYKVDPQTNSVVDQFPAPEESSGVRAGYGHVWITDNSTDEVVAMDPRTGKEDARVGVGLGARFLAVGEGAVWVLNQDDGSVARIDPQSMKVVKKIFVSEKTVEGGDIAVGGGFVWARVTDALVAQIDPATGTVKARFGAPDGSGSVAADDAAVWISAHDSDSLWRIPIN